MKFCNQCGEPLLLAVPAGDDRERHVCSSCAHVHYRNPRIITGCIPVHEDRVLLCRRAIEPRHGFWTLPAGFLEHGETIAEGAGRETLEEANARVDIHGLYAIYDVLHIGQVYMFHRATLADLDFSPGEESLATELFREQDIPWDELAFPVIGLVLKDFFADRGRGAYPLKTATINRNRVPGLHTPPPAHLSKP